MNTQIVEIKGTKIEVDLSTAKRIDTMTIGSAVKVLAKSSYGGGANIYHGVVVGFEPFPTLPSIRVAYLETDYSGATLKFLTFNEKTEGFEVVSALDGDKVAFEKADILTKIERDIAAKELALKEAQQKREFFLNNFHAYFDQMAKPTVEPVV